MTPLEKMLRDSGQVRIDGSDKFFGMENVSAPHITMSARTTGLIAIYL
jgi:ubiquitin carboxyl-terminal hydrolase 9/13